MLTVRVALGKAGLGTLEFLHEVRRVLSLDDYAAASDLCLPRLAIAWLDCPIDAALIMCFGA